MSAYLDHIIKYFFHHKVSEEIASRVQDRLVHSDDEADASLRDIWDELEGTTIDEPAAEKAFQQMTSTLFGEKEEEEETVLPVSHRPWLRIAAMWAVPLLILGAAAWFYTSATKQVELYAGLEYKQVFTANGERTLVTLPDSSKVWLNGGSTLVYPSHFISAERNVCLTGEAYFEVTKDSKRPFTVDVNHIKLKVLGTSFNVFSYPDNPRVMATLETGKLQVKVDNQKDPYLLTPDNQLVLDTKTGKVDMRSVHAADYSVWRVPVLYFEETELVYALRQIERTYNVKVHIQNSHFNHQTIRAHFNQDDSIVEIMTVIKMLIPAMNYTIEGNEIYIK